VIWPLFSRTANGTSTALAQPACRNRRYELRLHELRALHDIPVHMAVMHENLRPSLDEPRKTLVAVGGAAHHPVNRHQTHGAAEPADDRVVAAVHRVPHRIAQDQEQNEIERCELAHLTLARQSQQCDQKDVDDHGAS